MAGSPYVGEILQGFMVSKDHVEVMVRLIVATACGAMIGWERERAGKQAGLRTTVLVALGSALFTVLSMYITQEPLFDPETGVHYRPDPSRIASTVVSGIGFLGAGVIMHAQGQVVGMTTAATIWVVAAIGMAAGAGQFALALGSAILTLFVLLPLGWWEHRQYKLTRGSAAANSAGIKE